MVFLSQYQTKKYLIGLTLGQFRTSKIMRSKAKQKRNNEDSAFSHLLNGDRFCNASEIIEPRQRYSSYTIPNPLNPSNLIDLQIIIYHNNQVINCRKCLSDEHETKDCNTNKNMNNNLIIFRGYNNPLSNFYPYDRE